MTIFGITGHTGITKATIARVRPEVARILRTAPNRFSGMTCLARGSDQIFADIVLELGGSLIVVAPASDYFTGISDPAARTRCEKYLAAAESIVELPYSQSGPEAYFAGSRYVIDHCDRLLAVWDGSPPRNDGGTSDAVAYAQQLNRPVLTVWPEGSERT